MSTRDAPRGLASRLVLFAQKYCDHKDACPACRYAADGSIPACTCGFEAACDIISEVIAVLEKQPV